MLAKRYQYHGNNHAIILMIAATSMAMLITFWSYYSGQQLLKQQLPLVDSVMQIRVDISQAHELIHEGREASHGVLDKAYMMQMVERINHHVNELYQGDDKLPGTVISIAKHPELKASLKELQDQLNDFSLYLNNNFDAIIQQSDDDLVMDEHFSGMSALSQKIDEVVHAGVEKVFDRQSWVFGILVVCFSLFIALLFCLLRLKEKKNKLVLQQTTMLSQALEHSGEAAIIASADGVIEFVNDTFCSMTGYSSEETLGNRPSMLSSGKQNRPFYEHLWHTITHGGVWQGELTNRRKDGSFYPAHMTIAPIFDREGELTHYIANQRDLSEHKQLEKYLFQTQKLEAVGTLAGGIAHDFNNALAGITGNIFLLQRGQADQQQIVQRCSVIQDICDKAGTHIKQLLSYARNDSVLMDTVELNHCIQSACHMARSMVPSSVDIQLISDEEHLFVNWNAVQIEQILINLINNACHALGATENPNIRVELKIIDHNDELMRCNQEMTCDKYASVSIADNGTGMPADVMDKIFEPFFTTKDSEEGTGLGLSMAYGAIKQAGGCLSVESELGIGSTFFISLPLSVEPVMDKVIEPSLLLQGQGETVLIADDEKLLLRAQKEIVTSFGYHVLTANHGKEAVEVFEAHADEIDVVILDLVMPELSGPKVAKKILSMNADTKVIFSTGYDMGSSLKELSGSMKKDFPVVYKPFRAELMSKVIYEEIHKNDVR